MSVPGVKAESCANSDIIGYACYGIDTVGKTLALNMKKSFWYKIWKFESHDSKHFSDKKVNHMIQPYISYITSETKSKTFMLKLVKNIKTRLIWLKTFTTLHHVKNLKD